MEGKDGVVGSILGLATERWEKCVGCRVYASGNDGETYSVYQKLGGELEEEALLKVRPVDCVCDCGKWQAIGVPCVHGMAYFRHQMKWRLEDVLDQAVDEYYKYRTQRELYRRNFVPVWRHLLEPDMMTLPPDGAARRMPGRPKTVRLRKNSRYAHEPEKSPTICSRCHQPGHNVRTKTTVRKVESESSLQEEYEWIQQDRISYLQTYRQEEEEQGVVFSTNADIDDTSIDVVGVAEGKKKERTDYDFRRSTPPPPPPPTSVILPDFASSLRVVQKQRRNLDSGEQEEQLQLIVDQHSRLLDDDDKHREGDTAHLEIDCNDVNFDYEGDQLEACKEQYDSASPTPAETDLSTIFPALGSNNGPGSEDIEFGPSVNTISPTEFVADDAFGGGPGHGANEGSVPPLPPITIANGIRLHVSMAIIHLENLTHENTDTIVTMCLRTISRVLNRYSHVVYVRDYLRTPERRQQLHGELAVFEDEEKQQSDDDDDHDDDDDIRKLQLINLERNLRQRTIDESNNINNNNKDRQRTLGAHDTSSNSTNKQVKLILNNVHIQESPHMKNWYVIYADYAVYWMDSGRPILQSQVLWEINNGCDDVLDISLHRDDYWHLLTSLHFGQDLVLRKPDIEQPYQSYEKGLADCQDLGDEYDLDPFLPGSVGGGPASMEIQDEEPSTNGTATYPYVIATTASEIVWGTREWLGLALFLSTMVFAVSVLLIAAVLNERQRKQELWGVNLTEAGVNDFLGVGWRYTQEEARAAVAAATLENDNNYNINTNEEDGDDDTPQLFLQVYDKGRLGYNDENSMLQGGIERLNPFGGDEMVDPPNSSTAPTTMTPPH